MSRIDAARFGEELRAVGAGERDAWVNRTLGFGDLPDDEPLPRGCVPYLPCGVDLVQEALVRADVRESDTFVDVGSGVGRVLALARLLSGATTVGIELQRGLANAAEAHVMRLGLDRMRTLHGDAERLAPTISEATVFFFYCPFGADRLGRILDSLRPLAAARPLRICLVDMPAPSMPGLVVQPRGPGDSEALTVARLGG